MKRRHAAALALVGFLLVGCAQQQQQQRASTDPLEPMGSTCGETVSDLSERYADQPNLAAIRQYVVTGQMPSRVEVRPSGAIGSILQGLGVVPNSGPVTPDLRNRALAAKKQLDARCQAGDLAACHPEVNVDCRSGDAGACRRLCQLGDQAACIDYKRLLCE